MAARLAEGGALPAQDMARPVSQQPPTPVSLPPLALPPLPPPVPVPDCAGPCTGGEGGGGSWEPLLPDTPGHQKAGSPKQPMIFTPREAVYYQMTAANDGRCRYSAFSAADARARGSGLTAPELVPPLVRCALPPLSLAARPCPFLASSSGPPRPHAAAEGVVERQPRTRPRLPPPRRRRRRPRW